jgi:crotonobetainyl-CoA:carnitine CoA-transferase CaiB-like acyl-CoA transferase
MTGICDGLNVLEYGSGSAAVSMAGMVFADAGARVIKVEPPEGDRLRTSNLSGFLVWNRGKESVIADLRTAQGQDQLRRLAADADVVIEGFAPGTTARWGVSADALRAANPRLVHCSITGFGPTGPYSTLKGYDSLVAAKAGLTARGTFGHRDGPILFPVPWGSFGSAMQSVAGIIGALLVRDRTGRGQALDATMVNGIDPLDYFVATIMQLAIKKGGAGTSDTRALMGATRYGVLLITRDGRIVQTSTLLPHQGKALCEVAGIGHHLADPRFRRLPMFDSAEDAQAWEDLLLEAFRAKDLGHWLPLLMASPDIAFEVGVTSEEGLDHPQIVHNGDEITIIDPLVGPVRQVGPIGHFSRTPITPRTSAPVLGANAGAFSASPHHDTHEAAPAHPFAGVTIVEFGCFYAMPYGTAMMAALGARVIKIEDGGGDPHRMSFGPDVASNKTTAAKESLSLDLRTVEGRAIAHKIVAMADVFVSGFRSNVPIKLGLGYEELSALNPRLLYVDASGYGVDGPYAHRALYAQAAQAVAGSFGRQVGYWANPAQSEGMSVPELRAVILPRLNPVVDGDSSAALAVLAALALGVYHQQRTGEGQRMATSMIAGNAWCYSDDFCSYEGKRPVPLGDDDYHGVSAVDRVYPASDGSWICLVIRTEKEFAALVEAIGMPELRTDPRFVNGEARAANDGALVAELSKCFTTRSASEWESSLSAVGVGCVEANLKGHPAFTVFDPVLRATGLTVAIDHPLFGEMIRSSPPVAFSETPGKIGLPCVRGQHNRAILSEMGYTDHEIDGFEANLVVIPPA